MLALMFIITCGRTAIFRYSKMQFNAHNPIVDKSIDPPINQKKNSDGNKN